MSSTSCIIRRDSFIGKQPGYENAICQGGQPVTDWEHSMNILRGLAMVEYSQCRLNKRRNAGGVCSYVYQVFIGRTDLHIDVQCRTDWRMSDY